MAPPPRLQWRLAAVLAGLLAAGGCGISVPLGDLVAETGEATGSATASLALPYPLPIGLAPSDAAAIGLAVERALSRARQDAEDERRWRNPMTGSSGTLVALGEPEMSGPETCRTFGSTVTSIKGVHRYWSRACQGAGGEVRIVAIGAGTAGEPAGI
jgi:hypothetical protein